MQDEISIKLTELGKKAKEASFTLAKLSSTAKNSVLHDLANMLIDNQDEILNANQKDIALAKSQKLSDAMIDRLLLTPARIKQITDEVRHVASLPDPIGMTLDGRLLDSGLRLERRVVPLGVVAVIYEARPNVTIDVASLCLKTGNAVILRGGKETHETNQILVKVIQMCLAKHGLPEAAAQTIENPDRQWVNHLLRLDQYIDMLIPRGGAGLHAFCKQNSTIPVITGGVGVCHIYLDKSYILANTQITVEPELTFESNQLLLHKKQIEKTLAIIENAKIQRPSACNSLETLLLDQKIAEAFLPIVYECLVKQNVALRCCDKTLNILHQLGLTANISPVTEEFYQEESLGLFLNIKIVNDVDGAIEHIRHYGTEHSDAILTHDMQQADYFIDSINSAAIYVNASTRFTDGAQFGLGAEVAVSTQKLHARGPMGLDALTTYKWIGKGDGTIRT